MAEYGVTTSTYGLSRHFNENLMTVMAKAGQGQAHYGQTAEDLLDPFEQEFDFMEAILARRQRFQVDFCPCAAGKFGGGFGPAAAILARPGTEFHKPPLIIQLFSGRSPKIWVTAYSPH